MAKIVSQLDARGRFVGTTLADESPLEPGVFLIPGGAVDVEPPVVPDGKFAHWAGGWVFGDIPQPDEPEAPAQPEIPRVPQVVTRRQALLALLAAGKLDQIELAIQNAPRAVQIAWEAAGTFERSNPLIEALAPQVGLTDVDVDNLFAAAAQL